MRMEEIWKMLDEREKRIRLKDHIGEPILQYNISTTTINVRLKYTEDRRVK